MGDPQSEGQERPEFKSPLCDFGQVTFPLCAPVSPSLGIWA